MHKRQPRPSLFVSILLMMALALNGLMSFGATFDCSPLDPRAKVSSDKEGSISVAAQTLFKVANANGNVSGRIKSEIDNLQSGASVSEKTIIAARTIYVFCGMVANATDISTERKVELWKIMVNAAPPYVPPPVKRPKPPPPTQPPGAKTPSGGPPAEPEPSARSRSYSLSALGVPTFGATRDEVMIFLGQSQSTWREAADGHQYVQYVSGIGAEQARVEINLSQDSRVAYIIWTVTGASICCV